MVKNVFGKIFHPTSDYSCNKWKITTYSLEYIDFMLLTTKYGCSMVIWVVEFSREGYRSRKIFGLTSISSMKLLYFVNWHNGELSQDAFYKKCALKLVCITDYGHPERAFFQRLETSGLGQTNWAEILWDIWGISGQTKSTILALWVLCPWENVIESISYKQLWFLGLKHITPKCSQN